MSSATSTLDQRPAKEVLVRDASKPQAGNVRHFLRRAINEPLVHFLLIGFALFALYALFGPATGQPTSTRIELTNADIDQLQVTWMAQWKRPPSSDELRGLVDAKVQQEILYREALALGLEQNDEIIKRRLAQKMEFLGEDVSKIRAPQPKELKEWFDKNSAQFSLPGRITFRHLYFSPDKRGQRTRLDAEDALKAVSTNPVLTGREADYSDRFIDQNYFVDCSREQVSKIFGTAFTDSLFQLKPGAGWQGPVESGLGWHLVYIEALTAGRVPAFEELDLEQIKSEWTTALREETKTKAFAEIRKRYEVVLPK